MPSGSEASRRNREGYQDRPTRPSVDRHLTAPASIGAIDLHAHCDPDSDPRQLDGSEVAKLATERGMRRRRNGAFSASSAGLRPSRLINALTSGFILGALQTAIITDPQSPPGDARAPACASTAWLDTDYELTVGR